MNPQDYFERYMKFMKTEVFVDPESIKETNTYKKIYIDDFDEETIQLIENMNRHYSTDNLQEELNPLDSSLIAYNAKYENIKAGADGEIEGIDETISDRQKLRLTNSIRNDTFLAKRSLSKNMSRSSTLKMPNNKFAQKKRSTTMN